MDHITYFTIYPTREGVTSQIWQFEVLYNLGLALGYTYAHTPISAERSGAPHVYDFLGLNEQFNLKSTSLYDRCQVVQIDAHSMSQFLQSTEPVQPIASIKAWVESKFPSINEKSHLIEFHYIFKHTKFVKGSFKRNKFKKTIDADISRRYKIEQLDLHKTYMASSYKPRASKFEAEKTRLLLHIRQGDTAIIETPWNTYISIWGKHKFTEHNSLKHIRKQHIFPKQYYNFYKSILNLLGEDSVSTIVASDGYEAGYRKAFQHHDKIGLSEKQAIELKGAWKRHDQVKFKSFQELPNCTTLIGETEEHLYDLIHSAFHADMIVFGTQQRFIPKLFAVYSKIPNPPILIMLKKK